MLEPKPLTNNPVQIEPEVQIEQDISFGEGLSSAFRLENTLVSAAEAFGVRGERQNARRLPSGDGLFETAPDPNYDPFLDIEGTDYAAYSSSFVGVHNRSEARVIKMKIDEELEDRRVLETMGGKGFAAAILAGTIDPINLVPVGGTAVRGARLGQSVAQNASRTALAGGLGASIAELGLHPTQETRTSEESAMAVLGGVLLGGVLGGGVGAFVAKSGRTGDTKTLGQRLLNSVATDKFDFPGNSSVGAAQVQKTTLEQESLAGSFGVGEALSFQSPMTRSLNSGVADIHRDTMSLIETPFRFKKNDEGLPTTDSRGPVETQVTLARAVAVEVEEQINDIFVEMRKGRSRQTGDVASLSFTDRLGRGEGQTLSDFKKSVSEAFDVAGDSPDPFVARAVNAYSKMFETLGRQAEDLGLIPKGTVGTAVEGGGRYFPIDYNAEAIIANRPEWERILTENFVAKAGNVADELNLVSEDLAKLKRQRAEVEASLPDNRTLDIVRGGGFIDLGLPKRPVIDLLKTLGGIDPDSPIAGELRNIDITPSSSPGLFRKGGKKSLDDIVLSENELLRDNLEAGLNGFAQPDDIIGLIAREVAQDPARTLEQAQRIADEVGAIDDLVRFLEVNDIDPHTLTNDAIRQRLLNLDEVDLKDIQRSRAQGDDGVSGAPRSEADLEAEIREMELSGNAPKPRFGKSEAARLEKLEAKSETLRKLSIADDPVIARELAKEVTDTILGASRTQLPDNVLSGPRGPLRERTLDIDPSLTRDFRNTDITDIGRKYSRTTMVDMELVRKFGHTDMRRQFEKYDDAFEIKRAKALTARAAKMLDDGKLDHLDDAQKAVIKSRSFLNVQKIDDAQFRELVTESKTLTTSMRKLDKEHKQARQDMETMLKRVRGEMVTPRDPHSIWMKGQRAALAGNYLRLLGFQTVSAIPDLAIPIFKYGMRPFTAGWGQMITNFKNFNFARKELKGMGVGIEMAWDGRLQALSETFVGESGSSKFDRAVDATSRVYGIATLMTPWNALNKQIVGATVSDFIHSSVSNLSKGKLSKKHKAELARMNIPEDMALRIHAQLEAHAPNFSKERVYNLDRWDDAAARDNIRQAIPAETDRIILTPKNSKPTWMSTPQGQLVGQFKSFGFDAAQSIMVAGLQKRDAEMVMGMVMMMSLGAMVYKIKEDAAGRPVPSFDEDPGKWFTEAFDRSGMTGWLMDANNVAEKLTRGKVGLSSLTNSGPASRYASRNVLGALLGPSAGLVDDFSSVTGSAFQGEWTEKDTARARRLLPFQNAIAIRRVFDEFEDRTNKALGIDS